MKKKTLNWNNLNPSENFFQIWDFLLVFLNYGVKPLIIFFLPSKDPPKPVWKLWNEFEEERGGGRDCTIMVKAIFLLLVPICFHPAKKKCMVRSCSTLGVFLVRIYRCFWQKKIKIKTIIVFFYKTFLKFFLLKALLFVKIWYIQFYVKIKRIGLVLIV